MPGQTDNDLNMPEKPVQIVVSLVHYSPPWLDQGGIMRFC